MIVVTDVVVVVVAILVVLVLVAVVVVVEAQSKVDLTKSNQINLDRKKWDNSDNFIVRCDSSISIYYKLTS